MSEKNRQNDLASTIVESEKSPKVSVIVPVYKVEKYLPECIESVLAQTFSDFELILVDDGSPDNSGKICDDYAQKDSRIRVFHKENGGVSSARNFGIKNANAEWVAFLDSDDWWDLTYLEKMLNLSSKYPQVSCCCCWVAFVYGRGECKLRGFSKIGPGQDGLVDIIEYATKTGEFPIWTGAVILKRNELINKGGFNENLIVYEDYALWFKFCLDGKVAYHGDPLAFYRQDVSWENKPRGKVPDLKKHWVSHLKEYSTLEASRRNVKRFLDRFKLSNLLAYRSDSENKELFRKILKTVSPENWDWRYRLVYALPCFLGDGLLYASRVRTLIFSHIKNYLKS